MNPHIAFAAALGAPIALFVAPFPAVLLGASMMPTFLAAWVVIALFLFATL
jgi:hypothetical protein